MTSDGRRWVPKLEKFFHSRWLGDGVLRLLRLLAFLCRDGLVLPPPSLVEV